jgi:hemoglobin
METRQIPALYKWVGGIQRLEALFKGFYARAPADPILGPVFANMPCNHGESNRHPNADAPMGMG